MEALISRRSCLHCLGASERPLPQGGILKPPSANCPHRRLPSICSESETGKGKLVGDMFAVMCLALVPSIPIR